MAAIELKGERDILAAMRSHYEVALDRINDKIEALADRNDLSGIRQRKWQEALAEQIGGVLDALRSGSYATIDDYLLECYEQGFIGTMYNLQGQSVPLAFPLDQESAAKAVRITAGDIKLSKRIYSNVDKLQHQIISEITRGFADGEHAAQIAGRIAADTDIAAGIKRNVAGYTDQAFRRAMTIARTEKGRVKAVSTLEAMHKAKAVGADVVKQWDSTMDARTRPDHVAADGQVRELDEPFNVGGCKGLSPHLLGRPEQDCNCRCTCLQRARKALEVEDKYTKWDGVSQCYADMSDAKSYSEFKTKYEKLEM